MIIKSNNIFITKYRINFYKIRIYVCEFSLYLPII